MSKAKALWAVWSLVFSPFFLGVQSVTAVDNNCSVDGARSKFFAGFPNRGDLRVEYMYIRFETRGTADSAGEAFITYMTEGLDNVFDMADDESMEEYDTRVIVGDVPDSERYKMAAGYWTTASTLRLLVVSYEVDYGNDISPYKYLAELSDTLRRTQAIDLMNQLNSSAALGEDTWVHYSPSILDCDMFVPARS